MNDVVKNPVGRPRHYATADEFETACLAYFAHCDQAKEPYLITHLALHLGFSSRQEFYDQEEYDGYGPIVRWARTKVEGSYEKRLQEAKPTGAIFALKNMGWRDERHVDHKSSDGSMSPKGFVCTLDTSQLTTEQLAAVWGAMTVSNNAPDVP